MIGSCRCRLCRGSRGELSRCVVNNVVWGRVGGNLETGWHLKGVSKRIYGQRRWCEVVGVGWGVVEEMVVPLFLLGHVIFFGGHVHVWRLELFADEAVFEK